MITYKEFYQGAIFVDGQPVVPISTEYLDEDTYDNLVDSRDSDKLIRVGKDIHGRRKLLYRSHQGYVLMEMEPS